MALPNQIETARMTDSTTASTIDNEVGGLEVALTDILGIPIDTNISAAMFSVVAAGLQKVIFQDLSGSPSATGELARNGTVLEFHDGTAARVLPQLALAQTWTADQTFNDNVKVTLGTGGDADLYYDGTDVILDVSVVGSGDFYLKGGRLEVDDSEGVVFGTGKDSILLYDGNDTLWDLDAVGAGSLIMTRSTAGADKNCALEVEVDADNINSFVACWRGNRATPADNDQVVTTFDMDDDTNTRRTIIQVTAVFDDITSTSMDSSMKFSTMSDVNAAGVDTSATLTNAGVWTNASSFRHLKELELGFDKTKVLAALKTLEVHRYRRKGKPDIDGQERHIGPFADDFHRAFKTGKTIDGIAGSDMAGVALMACQELLARVEILEAV